MNTLISAGRILRNLAGCALLLLVLLRVDTSLAASVSAPATSTNGTYVVSYGTCSIYCLLEEKTGAAGTYAYVAGAYGPWPSNSGPGYGQYSVSGKPSGVYYYHVGDLYTDFYSYAYYDYSPEVATIVGTPPPPGDPISAQTQYNYETRMGDLNGDGLQDVLVRRTSGGTPGNGTLDAVILQRLANGLFQQVTPDSYQLSVAQGWPAVAMHVLLDDFNIDGYIDVILDNLGSYISGAAGQVILSAGQSGVTGAQALVPMDSKFNKFFSELSNWTDDPNWYSYNAPIVYVPIWGWVPTNCFSWYDEYGWYHYDCQYEFTIVGYTYGADYSSFDQDGLQLANAFHANSSGQMLPNLTPGSAEGKSIDAMYRRVFGVSPFRAVLDTGCPGSVFSYDGENQVNCNQTDIVGQILLATIKYYNFTDPGQWRYLTPGEKAQALTEGLQIRNVDQVRVYNKGYSIFNLNNYVMSPNGHIYVGLHNNALLPWREDYTAGPPEDLGVLIHELTHVFQVRTRGCITICMYLRAIGATYTYMPLVPGKAYYSYNIEQQAEMVEDRFRMRPPRNMGPYPGYGNGNVTLADLTIIPF